MTTKSNTPPRIGPGPQGRAVALGAVVDWLAERDELPVHDAIAQALQALCGPPPCAVYGVKDVGRAAEVVNVGCEWFATPDGRPGTLGGRRVYSRGIGHQPEQLPPARSLGHGMAGFCEWLGAQLRGAASAGQSLAGTLPWCVIAQADAARLFGWRPPEVAAPAPAPAEGQTAMPVPTVLVADDVKDYATLCQFMQIYKRTNGTKGQTGVRPLWRKEWVEWVRAEVKAHGRGGRTAVARELGISQQALTDVFRRHPEPEPPKASPFPTARPKAA